ncbi:MAG: hypothetical protein LBG15_02605 [Dysgonamonadaceae bacterium]|jgi:sensor histidine kinase YesM|nr:hypothetical protein [Dysgonamonadaceae bacterium]
MRTNIELKELWRKQTVPAVNLADLLIRIENYKTSGLKKIILLNALLVLTVFFVIFIWIYFNPQLLSSKIGIILTILPMIITIVFNKNTIPLYIKTDKSQSNVDYLNNLLEIKEKESYIQTKIMNLYFILLSTGIGLYMYEYTLMRSLIWGIVAYAAVLLWIGFNWFVLRPKIIRRNEQKIIDLIQQLEKVKSQIDEF